MKLCQSARENDTTMAGKGSKRRKCLISREEETLRYDLALGKMTYEEWVIGMQELKRIRDERIS